MSEGEREGSFETDWTLLTVEEARPPYRPWERVPWSGNIDAYREDLYAGMAFGFSDLPAFVQEWLEELARVGYYGMQEPLGLALKQQADNLSAVSRLLPLYGEAYPVRFENGGQVLWLQLDVGRSKRGYRNIAVADEPLRTDKAIRAALIALESRPLDISRLRRALEEILPFRGESVWDLWARALNEQGAMSSPFSWPAETLEDLQHNFTAHLRKRAANVAG